MADGVQNSLHSSLFTLHSSRFTLYSVHFTLYPLPFTLYTLRFILDILHFTLSPSPFTLQSPLFTVPSSLFHFFTSLLCTLHSSLFTLHYSLFTLHSSLFTLHSSLFTLRSSLFTLHSSLSLVLSHFWLKAPFGFREGAEPGYGHVIVCFSPVMIQRCWVLSMTLNCSHVEGYRDVLVYRKCHCRHTTCGHDVYFIGRLQVPRQQMRGNVLVRGSCTPDGLYHSSWDSVTPMTRNAQPIIYKFDTSLGRDDTSPIKFRFRFRGMRNTSRRRAFPRVNVAGDWNLDKRVQRLVFSVWAALSLCSEIHLSLRDTCTQGSEVVLPWVQVPLWWFTFGPRGGTAALWLETEACVSVLVDESPPHRENLCAPEEELGQDMCE